MEPNKAGMSGWMKGGASMPWIPSPVPMPSPEPMPTPTPMPVPPQIKPPAALCDDMVLVMSYVKMQQWDQTYEPETALERGTLFPELDLPFVGEGACPDE